MITNFNKRSPVRKEEIYPFPKHQYFRIKKFWWSIFGGHLIFLVVDTSFIFYGDQK